MMRSSWKFWRRTSIDDELSSYVDGLLDEARRAEIDAELKTSQVLRQRLGGTRATVDLLRSAEPISAPRSFALTPEQAYGPARPLERRGPSPMVPAFAAAAAAVAVGLLLVGNLAGTLGQSGGARDLMESGMLTRQENAAESTISSLPPMMAATAVGEAPAEKVAGPESAAPAPQGARSFALKSAAGTPEDPATDGSPALLASADKLGVGETALAPATAPSEAVLLPLWQLELALALVAIAFGSSALVLALRRRAGRA